MHQWASLAKALLYILESSISLRISSCFLAAVGTMQPLAGDTGVTEFLVQARGSM